PAGVSTSKSDTFRDFGASANNCLYMFFNAAASRATTSPAALNGVALQPASHAASPRAYAANHPSAAARTSPVTSGTTTVGAAPPRVGGAGCAAGIAASPGGGGVGSRGGRRGPSGATGWPRLLAPASAPTPLPLPPAPPCARAAFSAAFHCAPVSDRSCSVFS